MAYRDFVSISQLEDQFGITQNRTRLFEGIGPVVASETLQNELYESASLPLLTEKAKSEFLIAPILKELRRRNQYTISFFSGYNFDVAFEQGLTGFCDYLLTTETHSIDIKAPVFCVVEAKNRTTAYEWVFLRLHDNILDIDITQRYSLEEHSLPYLLGVMQHIIEQFID